MEILLANQNMRLRGLYYYMFAHYLHSVSLDFCFLQLQESPWQSVFSPNYLPWPFVQWPPWGQVRVCSSSSKLSKRNEKLQNFLCLSSKLTMFRFAHSLSRSVSFISRGFSQPVLSFPVFILCSRYYVLSTLWSPILTPSRGSNTLLLWFCRFSSSEINISFFSRLFLCASHMLNNFLVNILQESFCLIYTSMAGKMFYLCMAVCKTEW